MKILHVIRTMNPAWGGPVEGVRNIAGQAAARGHQLEVTCLDAPAASWLKTMDFHINAIGPGRYGKFGYSRRLDSWLAANVHRFDAVIADGIWMYFSAAVRRAAVRSKVPYFVFTHGALDPWFQRRYPHKQTKKTAYWLLFERKVMRDAAAVLFTTEEERLLSRGAFWPYQCKEQITGYGIADPALTPGGLTDLKQAKQELNCAFPALASRKFLLFLARIHEKKGIDILLCALANCREQFKDHALMIAGPGEDNYVMELKRVASRLGISRDLVWTGPLYRERKWDAIRSAEAYILPSHQENFGISVVEALACGVPVLITDKVNIWREVVADRAGFAESDNVAGITRLLKTWAEQPAVQIASMHTNARHCFCNHFDVVKTSSNLFALLQQHIN